MSRLVHQKDRVVDHDPPQHNATDIRLNIQGGLGQKKRHQDPHRRQRYGKHDHQGVLEGLVLTSQDHVHQNQGQDDGDRQFAKSLLLLFEITGHHQVIPHGAGYPV